MTHWVATMVDEDQDRMLPKEASMVKLYVTEMAKRVDARGDADDGRLRLLIRVRHGAPRPDDPGLDDLRRDLGDPARDHREDARAVASPRARSPSICADQRRSRHHAGVAVPLFATRPALAPLLGEVAERQRAVLESGRYILGPEVSAFEAELAAYLGVRHCVGVASGTDALTIGLRSLGCRARGRGGGPRSHLLRNCRGGDQRRRNPGPGRCRPAEPTASAPPRSRTRSPPEQPR